MAEQDVERGRSQQTSSSSESSESSESSMSNERISLLPPDYDRHTSSYKSTETEPIVEESSPEDNEPSGGEQNTKSVIAVISLLLIGVFISNADGSLVLATYGTIASEFGALGNASWLTTSFALALCASQPIVGKLSDIYGRKGVLLTSYALFAAGSVLCGTGQAMWQVIAGRIVTGIGGAGMTVIVSVLITDLVPLIQVAAWRSYVNIVATLGRSIGGPLGGLLADTVGWRWSFTGQGPLILVAILLVAYKLPSTAATIPVKGQPSKLRRIDFVGAFMLALTIVSLLGALSLGGQNLAWSDPIVISLAVGSIVLGTLFVTYEVRYALEPVFPPTLVVKRDIATSYAIMALQTAAQLSMMYSIPLYFRATQGSSNTEAGSHLFPAVLGNTVGGLLAGYTIQRTGRYRTLTILATISSSFTYALLILRWHGKTSWLESLYIIPGGFGTGMAQAVTFIALTSSVEKKEIATVTGGMYLASAVGMVVGVAVSSAVQMGGLRVLLLDSIRGPGSAKVIEKVISDVGSIEDLEEGVRKIVVECYVKSLEHSHMVSLAASLLALVIACTLREHSLR